MSEKPWGGRFKESTSLAVEAYTESISFDSVLYAQDIAGSKAHARMLGEQGIITREEADTLRASLDQVKKEYESEDINTIDGVKISFEARKEWVHLRRSNTEPIIRIYAEAATKEAADALAQQIIDIANKIIG